MATDNDNRPPPDENVLGGLTLWPHQQLALDDILAAIGQGKRRICVCAPTGAGKTVLMFALIGALRQPAVIYTHRRMLLEQTSQRLAGLGIEHGIRASGTRPALLRDIQISSPLTEHSRVFRHRRWNLHQARLVLIDECHQQTARVARQIAQAHLQQGAAIVGFTATPLDLEDLYEHLILAGTTSQLRAAGILLPCQTYAPDEPDLRWIGKIKIGEDLTESQNRKAIMRPGIFGRVLQHYRRLNPDGRPAILFGPDVAGSLWFAEQFTAQGIPAAHIDANDIWIAGQRCPAGKEARQELARRSADGSLKVVCNRFVMREGIDWPWLYHGIFACVFGSLTSYLQAGGRLLRAASGLDHVLIQDHGGNWHRHGSLNSDRQWWLGLTAHVAACLRISRMRERPPREPEPIVCPACGRVRASGAVCFACGHHSTTRSRVVVQASGNLKVIEGEIYRPRRTRQFPDTVRKWISIYHRAARSRNRMTFTQARGLFFYENGYWPPSNLPLMPLEELDWYRRVASVPKSQLVPIDPEAAPSPAPYSLPLR